MHIPTTTAPASGPVIVGSCDGAFRPPSQAGGRFGCGWRFDLPDQPRQGRRGRPLTQSDCSHSAELEALLALLDAYLAHPGPPDSQLVIYSDSRTLVRQVTGILGCKNAWCQYLLQQIQSRLMHIETTGWPVLLFWIPRAANQAAHTLAHRRVPGPVRPATRP